MLAFGSLTAPESCVAVLMQHDCVLQPAFFTAAWALHASEDFVSYGRGDELHSYTPEAVRQAYAVPALPPIVSSSHTCTLTTALHTVY